MGIALQKAISLVVSADAELLNILRVTAQMSLKSSLIALLLGVPLGIWLGDNRFPGRGVLLVLNRTLMGMPPVVCGLLFYMLFSNVGPINQILTQLGWIDIPIDFFNIRFTVRGLICLMNFLMWFGNTTILLMAGIMGIDQSLFEAANIDGASSLQVFFKVTLPLLMPILVYTIITALIGGLQMFDVPQVLTNALGTPNRTSTTLVMYLNNYLKTSKNYGMSGAISVVIFVITGLLSLVVFKSLTKQEEN